MSLIKYIERISRIDSLIHRKATGTPEEFAERLGIRRSTLFQNLQELRDIGVGIKYSYERQTYFYTDNRRIRINIENILYKQEVFENIG